MVKEGVINIDLKYIILKLSIFYKPRALLHYLLVHVAGKGGGEGE